MCYDWSIVSFWKSEQAVFAKCDRRWLGLSLKGRELRVLLVLSLYAEWSESGHGRCFSKREILAKEIGLQVSHVSEALRTLAEVGLIAVVRLGRKNIYYIRPIGETYKMPPSDPMPFFHYLYEQGIHLRMYEDERLQYIEGSKKFNDILPCALDMFTDYVNGLMPERLFEAISRMSSSIERSF